MTPPAPIEIRLGPGEFTFHGPIVGNELVCLCGAKQNVVRRAFWALYNYTLHMYRPRTAEAAQEDLFADSAYKIDVAFSVTYRPRKDRGSRWWRINDRQFPLSIGHIVAPDEERCRDGATESKCPTSV